MKTFSQCMTEIESAIKLRTYGEHKTWWLVYDFEKFKMVAKTGQTVCGEILIHLNDRQCIEGLNNKEWQSIENQILILLVKGVIK